MTTHRSDWKRQSLSPSNGLLTGHETLLEHLKYWRQRLGYGSLFAALPALLAGGVSDARAEDPLTPEAKTSGREAGFAGKKKRRSKPPLFFQLGNNRLPYQKGMMNIFPNLLPAGGNDDCPGEAIPNGTYTVASPFTDTGDTTGANTTVNELNY